MIRLHRTKQTYTQMSTSKTKVSESEGQMYVNILVVLPDHSSARCDHWRKMGKGNTGSLCVVS